MIAFRHPETEAPVYVNPARVTSVDGLLVGGRDGNPMPVTRIGLDGEDVLVLGTPEDVAAKLSAVQRLVDAARAIRDARDHHAETGDPHPDVGDRCFDDWAADIAHAALEPWDRDTENER